MSVKNNALSCYLQCNSNLILWFIMAYSVLQVDCKNIIKNNDPFEVSDLITWKLFSNEHYFDY